MNRFSKINTIYKIKFSILEHEKEIQILEAGIEDMQKTIDYQESHGFSTDKTKILLKVNETKKEYLKAMLESDVLSLKEAEKDMDK
jgi:Ser-tRNA(Ala) deacylase AlaX